MEEANGDGDRDKEKQSPTHAGDGDEYFEVEAIKSCKLSSRVRRFSVFFRRIHYLGEVGNPFSMSSPCPL
jgi:hypothetical protein